MKRYQPFLLELGHRTEIKIGVSSTGHVHLGIYDFDGHGLISLTPDEAANVAKELIKYAIYAEMLDTQPGSEP